jgi:16S rRNA A1518/A1519 N6-dimethyltransferase RsmA/KsgA/DIM1 with predicted DNA glycosylase/AP lyase activity
LSAFVFATILKEKNGEAVQEILKSSGLSGDRRPETLDIGDFTRLAEALEVVACGT